MEQEETITNPLHDSTKRRKCEACGLFLNQLPVYDKSKKAHVFWVGLSSVLITEDVKVPLSPNTRTGALIEQIETPFREDISFYKTNVVKCLPLSNNKIRYPLKHEMEKCYPNLQDEIEALKPSVIFLLGKQVANFVLGKHSAKILKLDENFDYEAIEIDGVHYVPVHHPSFIQVYRRKKVDFYIEGISKIFDMIFEPELV